MPAADPYNALTRSLFADLRHGGGAAAHPEARCVQVAESAGGARLELCARVEAGRLADCRFRAYGCPQLLAAAEWLCRNSEGEPLSKLDSFDAAEIRGLLGVPVEKTGRILLLEDAVALLSHALRDRGAAEA